MRYKGSQLKTLLSERSGSYSELEKKMRKYRKPRKNGTSEEYNLRPLYNDGHNITISTLSALMKETGKPLDFFVEFEPHEMPSSLRNEQISGNNNIINSHICNDLTYKVEHLESVIKLKDELLTEKERNIQNKDTEIATLRKVNDKLMTVLDKTN